MANSKFASIHGHVAILVGFSCARSGHPVLASADDRCPARRARRGPRSGGRIRARQAPAADPESVAKTVAQSPFNRSRGRRSMCGLHSPGPVDPFRDCLQTVHAVAPASSADPAELSRAFFVESTDEARSSQGAQPRRHRRRCALTVAVYEFATHTSPQQKLGYCFKRQPPRGRKESR